MLYVRLFGNFQVALGDNRRLDLGSPTTRALFAYLVLQRGERIDRRGLAFALWPRATESAARRNLRQYLHRLRRALEPHLAFDSWVQVSGSALQILRTDDVWVDVEAFAYGTRPQATLEEIEHALLYYRGDLLTDLYDEWCAAPRQHWHQQYIAHLARLGQGLLLNGEPARALEYALQWLEAEPLDEAAHRLVMQAYAGQGQRHRVFQQYQSLCALLEKELQTEPEPETRNLFARLQENGIPQTMEVALPVLQSTPPEIPLFGRDEELRTLTAVFERARQGEGALLLLTGEAGIGKTRLMQECLLHQTHWLILSTSASELEAMTPYAAVRHLLTDAIPYLPPAMLQMPPRWLMALASLTPALQSRLPYLPAEVQPVEENVQLMDALVTAFLQLQSAPLCLVIDDLHWADAQTWNWIAALAPHLSTHAIVLLGLCRWEDLSEEHSKFLRRLERNAAVRELPVKRLERTAVDALVRHLRPSGETSPAFLERLYQETEGNPFFIIEILRALDEGSHMMSGQMHIAGETTFTGLPLAIQQVIEARLERLPEQSREFLGVAAAIGSATTFSFLAEVTQASEQDLLYSVETWVRRGLMRETPDGYDFSHDKIRQVTYGNLSRARRQIIHRRIADALERVVPPVDVNTLAYHYARSDRPLQALPYLTQAAEQALRARSYHTARQLGMQAVQLLGHMPGPAQRQERIDLNLQLAQAYAFSGDLRRAWDILQQTERLAQQENDEIRLGQVFRRMGQILWQLGEVESAGDYARRALRVAEEKRDAVLLQASLRMLGRVGIALAAFDDAIAYLLRYVSLVETTAPPDLPVVLGYLGMAYARIGSWQRARETAERGEQLAVRLMGGEAGGNQNTLTFARMQLAFVHTEHHDWARCLQVLKTVPPHEVQADELTPLGFMVLGLRGYALANSGNSEEGLRLLIEAVNWARRTDYRVFSYLPMMFLGQALLFNGQVNAAQTQIEYALEYTRRAGNRWAVGVSARLLAEVMMRQPHPDWGQVENLLIESMDTLRRVRARPELARTFLALRRLYDRAGQIAWAVDCHFRATTIFEELEMQQELRLAQGQAAGERQGAVVIPNMPLRGPNSLNASQSEAPR
ncbi:MAG: hypothetical protein Fur0018_19300 [Anaerolineales bacterium]